MKNILTGSFEAVRSGAILTQPTLLLLPFAELGFCFRMVSQGPGLWCGADSFVARYHKDLVPKTTRNYILCFFLPRLAFQVRVINSRTFLLRAYSEKSP